MRTINTQISKQTAIGQIQGCVAIATECGRTLAAQHLDLGLSHRLHSRQLSHLWHGLRSALIGAAQNAWQLAAQILNSPGKAGTKRPTNWAFYLMPVVGLVPVAARRLPVADAIGMPMPRSADC
jgi:hypothetical protein